MAINEYAKGKAAVRLALLFFLLGQYLLIFGQDSSQWQMLNAKFFLENDQRVPKKDILTSSAYFLNEDIGWMVGTNGKWLGASRGMIARTHDGGKTWKVEFSTTPSEFSEVFFISPQRGWIVGSEQSSENKSVGILLDTFDGGKRWNKRRVSRMVKSDFSSVYFKNERVGFLAGGGELDGQIYSVIFRTSNGGRSWDLASRGTRDGFLREIKFDKQGEVGWAVGDNGEILKTKDGGKTWSRQRTQITNTLFGISILDQREVWVTASDFSLLHTADEGTTWQVTVPKIAAETIDDEVVWFSGVFFENKSQGWVSGSNGIILSTNDSGVNWHLESINKGGFLYKIVRVDKKLFAIGKEASLLQKNYEEGFFASAIVRNRQRRIPSTRRLLIPRSN